MAGPGRFSRPYRSAFYFLTVLFLAITLIRVDHSCLDAADSAYLISADAFAGGLMPYRDFLAAHPPLLYLLGVPLAWLGGGVLPFRIFSLLVLAGLGIAVWRLALRLTGRDDIAFLAGGFMLFAPLSLYFSKLFIQDSLVALLAVAAMSLLLGGSRRQAAAAGILCIFAALLKLTFLPLLLVFIIYVYRYRREHLSLFLWISIAIPLALVLLLELISSSAFLEDIILAQASKGYSLANLSGGLHRIWRMDLPLLVAAVPGLWYMNRQLRAAGRGDARFMMLGWLAAGALVLLTLTADGHDTNLFQLMEPTVVLLAAWGIMGLASEGRILPVAAALILLLASVVFIVGRDRSHINRSNSSDVASIVESIGLNSDAAEAILAPGCYALEAQRPVARRFFDQFLWEEKYDRGDADARGLYDALRGDLDSGSLPVVVMEDDRPSLEILGPSLERVYRVSYSSSLWPPVTLWLPGSQPED